jgi:hypothetical protein
MSVITSLTVPSGGSAHITAQVLDQFGQVMLTSVPVIVDPGPNTSFASDPGTTGAGIVSAVSAGTDILTATYGILTSTLPVTVPAAVSVPTSIQWTTP